MMCPTCTAAMQLRDGKFGAFYFCPEQYSGCEQKTISEQQAKDLEMQARCKPHYGFNGSKAQSNGEASHHILGRELAFMEAQQSPLFSGPSKLHPNCERPFDAELDDPIYDDGSDFRPW